MKIYQENIFNMLLIYFTTNTRLAQLKKCNFSELWKLIRILIMLCNYTDQTLKYKAVMFTIIKQPTLVG